MGSALRRPAGKLRFIFKGASPWVLALAVGPALLGGAPAFAQVPGPQAPGAGASPTPQTQPSVVTPGQPEGSPGFETRGVSGPASNVTGPSGGAQANGAAGTGTGVAEVVVTARRVTENIQNVPLSVTAIGSRELDVLQVRQVTDLGSLIPDVSVQPTAVAGGGIVYIRGIPSQALPNIALDNRVGIYLDGVYIAREEGQSFALSDIQQVEVLKGPQGTLFGKNVTGGAINFITQGPTGRFGGDVEAGYGDYNRQRYKATINLPEFDGFSTRFSYAYDARDGDIKNTAAGRQFGPLFDPATNTTFPSQPTASTLGSHENQSFFAAVRYKGINHLTVDYKFDYAQDYQSPNQDQSIGFPGTAVGCAGASFFLGGPVSTCGTNFTSFNQPIVNAGVSHPSIAFNKLSDRDDPFDADNLIRTFGNNLTLQYEVTPDFSIKSITAYRQLQVQIQENTAGGDFEEYNDSANFFKSNPIFGNNPTNLLPAGGTSFFCASCSVTRTWQHQFSEEVQGIGKIGHVLDYVAGLYYFDEGGGTVNAFEANAAPLANYGVAIAGVAPQGLPPLTSATTTLPASTFLNGEAAEILSQSAAAYLHLTGHVTDKLDLSAGVRYSDDYKSQTVSSAIYTTLIDPSTITPANPSGSLVPKFRSVNFGRITYDGTATYHFTPDINAYVRYATAYLAGGLFRNIEFKPEDTKAEEVGVKSQFFGHKLQIDGALFHQEDANYQDNNVTPEGALFVANVGRLTTQGGELQATYVPIRGLTFSGNGGYADQHYSDDRPPAAPRLTLAFNAQYDLPRFSNDMYVSLEADTNYSSKYHSIPYALSSGVNSIFPLPPAAYQAFGFNTQAAYLDYLDKQAYDGGYWITNARVSLLDIPVDGYKGRLSFFATNLFDERGPLYTQNYGLFIGTNFQPDRAYGVDLAVAF